MKEVEEEDYALLIYQDTMRRRAEATTAAVEINEATRRTSTRICSAARNDSSMDVVEGKQAVTKRRRKLSEEVRDDEQVQKKVVKYRRIKLFSTTGCTNTARRGGLCCRHGSRILCSSKGCTNQAQKKGVSSGMGRRRDNAAAEDARVKLKREDCAAGMEARGSAELKDVKIKL